MPDPCLSPSPRISLVTVGSPGALTADVVPSPDAENGVELRGNGLWTPGRPEVVVGSLPATPADGDEIYYLADAANSVLWHLRYYSAEVTAYKWIMIGGQPLIVRRKTGTTIAPGGGNSWTATADVGPSVVLPLAGFYGYRFGANINPNSGGNAAQVGVSPFGFDPTDDNTATQANAQSASVASIVEPYSGGFGAQAAGVTMRLMYRCDGTGGIASYNRRFLEVIPYKLG